MDEVESIRSVYMISLDDYNSIAGRNIEMSDDELLLYPFKAEYDYNTLSIDDCGTWNVELMDELPFPVGAAQANIKNPRK